MKPAQSPAWRALQEATAAREVSAAEGDSVLLYEAPRGPRRDPRAEVVRWSLDTFRPPDAPETPRKYVSARRWFRAQDGSYRPTREGITVRAGELSVVKALCSAARTLGLLPAKGGDRG
jgi:hypothetical protein